MMNNRDNVKRKGMIERGGVVKRHTGGEGT